MSHKTARDATPFCIRRFIRQSERTIDHRYNGAGILPMNLTVRMPTSTGFDVNPAIRCFSVQKRTTALKLQRHVRLALHFIIS